MTAKTLRSSLVLALGMVLLGGCVTPFSDHAADVRNAWAKRANEAHRRWDRYVYDLDWDDPTIDWVDESYATGPMHR
ncbi:MAG: hypothetical protein H6825_14235 [Planctomycetes bacterium]|nr:hypothetical protein [Planctomycetota bacterium]